MFDFIKPKKPVRTAEELVAHINHPAVRLPVIGEPVKSLIKALAIASDWHYENYSGFGFKRYTLTHYATELSIRFAAYESIRIVSNEPLTCTAEWMTEDEKLAVTSAYENVFLPALAKLKEEYSTMASYHEREKFMAFVKE